MQIHHSPNIVAHSESARAFLDAQDVTLDREFRWEYALGMSEEIRHRTGALWQAVDHRCRDCGNFMHALLTHASETIACWDCAKNNEAAQAANALRLRLQMIVSGYEIGRDHTNYHEGTPL